MRSRRPFEWKPTLVYGVAAALFAMTLSYFLWSWMGVPNPPVIRDVLWYLLIMAVLIALTRYPMVALSLFFLAIAWQWITWPETVINEDSTFLWKWIQDVYDAFFWGLTLNPFKGAMPLSFVPVLRIVTSFLSFVFLYAIPFPAMALTLLAGPLFFMPELGIHPHWLIWLFMGLGCITISFYRPTDTSRRKLPHPGIVAGLLATVFLLQSVLSPSVFFDPQLSTWINDRSPRANPDKDRIFTLDATGFYPESRRLGGSIVLKNQPLMEVEGPPYAFYLRGTAYNEFLGDRWELPSMSDAHEFVPLIITSTMPDNMPPEQKVLWPIDFSSDTSVFLEVYDLQSAVIQPLTTPQYTVFNPGILHTIASGEWIGFAVEGNPEVDDPKTFVYNEHMILAEEPIDDGVYLFGGFVTPERSEQATAQLAMHPVVQKDAPRKYEELVRQYDEKLHQLIYEQLAEHLDDTFYTQLMLSEIRAHFQENYPYSLQVPDVPVDRPLISWFLETKKGYCVYYGTTAAELLSDIGIKTRYAEGFLVPSASSDARPTDGMLNDEIGGAFSRTVTSNSAHAWAEIEYEGVGWYPYETTPTSHIARLNAGTVGEEQREEEPRPSRDPETPDQRDPIPRTEPDREEAPAAPPKEPSPLLLWARANRNRILITVAVIAYLIWRRYVYRKRHDQSWIEKTYRDRPALLTKKIWKDIEQIAKITGTDTKRGTVRDTLLQLADHYSIKDIAIVSSSIWVIEQTLYSEQAPEFSQLQPLLSYHKSLDHRIRNYLPWHKWFLLRWLWSRSNPL